MKKTIIHFYFLCIIFNFLTFFSCQQKDKTNEDLASKIDLICQHWNHNQTPGMAIAIVQDGDIIFKKGYGMANLEYNIPIQPSTIFHIASESKQFTNFCIVLLAQRGLLSLDDDIRKYLPDLPDFGKKITIKNLIYHTSGLRDQWQLLAISGTRIDDVITQDHILKLIKMQKRLNFDPGERHLYCNTGYTLLAEIVKKVSGLSLREFADKEIFKPLGMNNTHFHDNYKELINNRAFSYEPSNMGYFENSVLSYSTVGATSLFTTVEDEAKWVKNFLTAQVGGQKAIEQMFELGVLNSGDTLNYAFGLYIDSYKGWKRIRHGGSDAGFRSLVTQFPEKNLSVIFFSNVSNIDRSIPFKIADLFLEDKNTEKKSTKNFVSKLGLFKEYVGKYNSSDGFSFEIIDSLKLFAKFGKRMEEMIPISDSSFSIFNGAASINLNKKNKNTIEYREPNTKFILQKHKPVLLHQKQLINYCGIYKNEETGSQYQIICKDEHLVLQHQKYNDVYLTPITKNQFSCPHWWMSNLNFKINEKDEILGFDIHSDRIWHLDFEKIQ